MNDIWHDSSTMMYYGTFQTNGSYLSEMCHNTLNKYDTSYTQVVYLYLVYCPVQLRMCIDVQTNSMMIYNSSHCLLKQSPRCPPLSNKWQTDRNMGLTTYPAVLP